MEAAHTLSSIPEQLRSRRFARECEQLRPDGIGYILRRYGNTLDHADAEDAVAEVLIRLHRQAAAGRAPDNLRAAFFTSCHNAAIDQLRSRQAKPTVTLEVVAEAPLLEPSPEDRAERADDGVRLREALARMRPNYREAILLRFGLRLTVPEIAERLDVSLPAAKKRVLRATNEIRRRMESIEGAEFCPEMRDLAQRSLFDRQAAGLAAESESAVLKAHFEHCGSCRTFLTALHDNLHELGSTALLTGFAAERAGAPHHLTAWLDHLSHAVHTGLTKLRLAAFRTTGSLAPDGGGAAGALAGTSQKIAAICTAGAATATCLAAGVIGPGIGAVQSDSSTHHARAAAQVRSVASQAPTSEPTFTATTQPTAPVAPTESKPKTQPVAKLRQRTKSPESQTAASASRQSEEEFGFEGETQAPAASTANSSSASASSAESTPAPTPTPAPSSSSPSSSGGTEKFGFGG